MNASSTVESQIPPPAPPPAATRKWPMRLAALVVLAVFAVHQVAFILRAGNVAVLTRFGRPLRSIMEPGFYFKYPWPIDVLHIFDGRLRCRENPAEETFTADQQNIIVTTYIYWRISDPILFLQRAGDPETAAAGLDGLVRSRKNLVMGAHAFNDLINSDSSDKFEAIEEDIRAPVAEEARRRYGVEVPMLGIRSISLPDSVAAKVFERMRAERKMVADRFRAEGESAAERIRAQAGQEREKILVEAEVQAAQLMAEGDAAAAEYYAVFETNPELAVFLRKLDALAATLKGKSTVILGTETAPYDLLKQNDAEKQ